MHEHRPVTADMAMLIKGMLARGDKQSDIAACFLVNGGRVAEINKNKKKKFASLPPAPADHLPPPGPYPSPYELWKTKREIWKVRVALEELEEVLRTAMVAVHKIEQR